MKGSFRDRAGVGLSVDYRIGDFQIRNYFSYTSVKSKDHLMEFFLIILKSYLMMR